MLGGDCHPSEGGTVYRYHTEPSGVPTRLTAPGGRTVWEAELEAFGQARVRLAEVVQPWRLPGQYADDEFGLGLHYNRFRYYDPAIGRYISRDPVGVAGGLNLYCYVGNDPINRADPMGLWWKTALLVVAAVAVVAVVAIVAPVLLPVLAIGAVVGGVVEAVTQETFCLSCVMLRRTLGVACGAGGCADQLCATCPVECDVRAPCSGLLARALPTRRRGRADPATGPRHRRWRDRSGRGDRRTGPLLCRRRGDPTIRRRSLRNVRGLGGANTVVEALVEDNGDAIPEAEDDEDLDPEACDTSYLCASAAARGLNGRPANIEARRAFWLWYLDEAIPEIYALS